MALLAEMGLVMMERPHGTGVTLQMILANTRSVFYTSLLPHFLGISTGCVLVE